MFAKSYALESVCKNLRLFGFEVEVVYKNLVSISIKVKFCKKKTQTKGNLDSLSNDSRAEDFMNSSTISNYHMRVWLHSYLCRRQIKI